MLRRKTMMRIRKYLIVFFGILLIFIWVNHCGENDDKDIDYEHFPPVSIEATSDSIQPDFLVREKQLRELIQRRKQEVQIVKIDEEPETQENKMDDKVFIDFGTEATNSVEKPSRYFVYSKKCRMPYADPFSREAMEIYQPSKLKVCSTEPDLFQLTYDQKTKHYQLQVNQKNLLEKDNQSGQSSVRCNYRAVARSNGTDPDNRSEIHPPVYFSEKCTLPQTLSGIMVECRNEANASKIVQQDAFPLVQVYNSSTRSETHPLDRQPSVIILGLDSMSRMNFRRTMPKTAKYVARDGWFELEGYNKVGDNTVPNVFPILTGHTLDQMSHFCHLRTEGCLDKMPWIWKDYKKAGYATATAEDSVADATFTMDFAGFYRVPTDYYLRPLMLAINSAMQRYKRFGFNYCIGRRLSVSYVFDFCSQFTSRYVEELDQPAFGFFWSCTFTHDFYFAASSLDDKFSDYLRFFEQHQLFERSIVILMSDHGARFGDLMELSDSFLEERLPMMHIYLPPWFRNTYPKYAEALSLNRNRLCSNFDLHNTLRHILQLNASTPAELPPLSTCPSSQSLLHPLPEDRGCQDACIGEHWCTCNEFVKQKLNGDIYMLGKQVIYHINRWMLVNRFNQFCQRILLLDMEYAAKRVLFEENGKETMYGSIVTYRLGFRTTPHNGKFQTTVRYNRELRTIENLYVPDISRMNSYQNYSDCVDDKVAKKFCFCYPKTKLNPFMKNWQNLILTTLPTF